jgi:hypothetical protein
MTMPINQAHEKLTTDEVRTFLGVSQATIYNHRAALRGDDTTGTRLYPREAVETWQGLREADVLRRADAKAAGIVIEDLLRARLDGVITPTPPPDQRMSYRDVQQVIAWKAAGCPPNFIADGDLAEPDLFEAAEPNERPSRRVDDEVSVVRAVIPLTMGDVLSSASDGWTGMISYIRTGDVGKIPSVWWASPQCPQFILPASIRRGRYREAAFDHQTGRWWTAIYEDAHFLYERGHLAFRPPRLVSRTEGLFPFGAVPADYESMERRAELALRAWRWRWLVQRIHELEALGLPRVVHADEVAAEPRDRIVLEHRYHVDQLRPEQLPSWYLVTSPSYLPRTNIHEYTFGLAQGGSTPIVRSAGWTAGPGQAPQPVTATFMGWAQGQWPIGQRVPWYDPQNRDYDAGAQEWSDEIAIRRRRWPLRFHPRSIAAAARSPLALNLD